MKDRHRIFLNSHTNEINPLFHADIVNDLEELLNELRNKKTTLPTSQTWSTTSQSRNAYLYFVGNVPSATYHYGADQTGPSTLPVSVSSLDRSTTRRFFNHHPERKINEITLIEKEVMSMDSLPHPAFTIVINGDTEHIKKTLRKAFPFIYSFPRSAPEKMQLLPQIFRDIKKTDRTIPEEMLRAIMIFLPQYFSLDDDLIPNHTIAPLRLSMNEPNQLSDDSDLSADKQRKFHFFK